MIYRLYLIIHVHIYIIASTFTLLFEHLEMNFTKKHIV